MESRRRAAAWGSMTESSAPLAYAPSRSDARQPDSISGLDVVGEQQGEGGNGAEHHAAARRCGGLRAPAGRHRRRARRRGVR